MKQNERFAIIRSPVFQVLTTWIWFFVGGVLTVLIIMTVLGVDLATAPEVLGNKRYLAVYIEIVSVGLLPVVFTLVCRNDLTQYGLGRKELAKSLKLSALFTVALFGFALLTKGQLMTGDSPSFHLNFPWNLWYTVLGIFAWGPLEVFFVMWLVTNTDRIFKSKNRTLSWGLIVTVLIFGIAHILTTQSIYNAFYTGTIFFILGLIYKYTGNSIGPMIAWTLINGQVWFMAQILLS